MLTSAEALAQMEEKKRKKQEELEAKERRKVEREEKKIQREAESKRKAELRKKAAEERAKRAEEKDKEKKKRAEERERKAAEKRAAQGNKKRKNLRSADNAHLSTSSVNSPQNTLDTDSVQPLPSNAQPIPSTSAATEDCDQSECAVCLGAYRDDVIDGVLVKEWIRCTNTDTCGLWMHADCVDMEEDNFVCYICGVVFK